jgi:hypothetical protein
MKTTTPYAKFETIRVGMMVSFDYGTGTPTVFGQVLKIDTVSEWLTIRDEADGSVSQIDARFVRAVDNAESAGVWYPF